MWVVHYSQAGFLVLFLCFVFFLTVTRFQSIESIFKKEFKNLWDIFWAVLIYASAFWEKWLECKSASQMLFAFFLKNIVTLKNSSF